MKNNKFIVFISLFIYVFLISYICAIISNFLVWTRSDIEEGVFPTDVGGHIQACSHGGTCDRYNFFPQDGNFNNSAYKVYFENITGKALKEGKEVSVNTRFIRNNPSSSRPDQLEIQFSIDGVKQNKLKLNNEVGKHGK